MEKVTWYQLCGITPQRRDINMFLKSQYLAVYFYWDIF